VVKASVEDENRAGPRVQNAVKAIFFGKSVEVNKAEDQISLRYSDLRQVLRSTGGAVADKTISVALKTMVAKGQLTRRPEGREVYYRLTIPRDERVAAFAKSDSSAIQMAARLGGIGDLDEGWAFYGVPELFKDKIRGRLRRSSLRFRKEIAAALDRAADDSIKTAIRRVRGRMPRADLWKVEETLYHVLQLQAVGAVAIVRGALLWSNLETMMPGSLAAWKRALGLPELPAWQGELTDAHIDALAKALGVPPDELRAVVAKEVRKLERANPLMLQFFEFLGPEEGDRFGRQLSALVGLVANLTAITRV
jgi:hypothetical protein